MYIETMRYSTKKIFFPRSGLPGENHRVPWKFGDPLVGSAARRGAPCTAPRRGAPRTAPLHRIRRTRRRPYRRKNRLELRTQRHPSRRTGDRSHRLPRADPRALLNPSIDAEPNKLYSSTLKIASGKHFFFQLFFENRRDTKVEENSTRR